jgi:hypothetical protein
MVQIGNGILTADEPIYMRGIEIGMDENGNVTNANIVRSNLTNDCLVTWVEGDIDLSTNKDVEDEESSASGDVDITGAGDVADLTVVGGGALLAGIGIAKLLGQTGRGFGGNKGDESMSRRDFMD